MKTSRLFSAPPPTPTRQAHRSGPILGRWLRQLAALLALLSLIVALTSKSAADTLTFQQGVGGYTGLKQTTLFQSGAGASAVNGGLAAGTWTVDGGSAAYNDGQFKQGLIWFDNIFGSNPGQIPLGSTITSATITAAYNDPSSSAFAVYRMLQTWSPASATWNSFTGGMQNDGTEAAVAATATFSNPNGNASGTYNAYGTSLTADLQLFSNGTPNYGWVVLPTSGSAGWGWTAAQTNSPVLSVTFTPPASTLAATITSPANSATVGQSFTIFATASAVSPASVTSVTFKDGATVLGVDTTSPYSWNVTGAALGSHTLTAVVTDSNSATATSSPVNVTVVNAPPTVSLTSPTEGSSFTVGSNVTLNATAADDVAVTNVEFFVDNVSIGTDITAPYSAAWNNVPLGAHVLKAVATDGTNSTTSTLVNVTVTGFGALQFDGVDDYVTMGVASGLGAQAFTLECWVKHDPSGTGRTTASSGSGGVNIYPLIGKGRGEGDGSNVDCNYTFGLQTDGRLAADFEDFSTGLNHPVVGTSVVPSNTWHHVAVTYDSVTGIWKLYIDGVLDNSVTISGSGNVLIPRYDSVQHFGLGTAMTSTGATQGFFKGVMDEVRVWNVARTQAEIQSTMNSEVVSATGLIGRWSLNESNGTAAINSGAAGTGVNGTLTGANGLPARTTGYPFGPQAPTVAITSPANGATVPTSFTINATAADSDGTVSSVAFYDGATLLGTDTTSPYSYAWTGASVGAHALTAVAVDNSSSSTTSGTVNVTVSSNNPPTISPTAPADEATGIGASTTVSVNISDPEGAATTVTFYGRKTTPLAPGPDFTLMTLPDTQYYSQNTGGLRADTYYAQTQWITDNRDVLNVAFVSHMGDIVQNGDFSGNPREWLIADAAMRTIESQPGTLRAHGIPWGGAPGNHDQSPIGDASGSTVFYNEYFGSSRFTGRTYYAGRYGIINNNNYQLFSASGLDFIILHLEYDTRSLANYQAVLDWADALLKAYPNRRAIVTTHWMVNIGNPATFSTQGQAIYDNLKDNPNLFLLLGGHVHGEGQRGDVFEGRTVNSILQDYQGRANGGDGWLRYFVFSPANNTITAKTYKVANTITPTSGYESDADSEFALTYNMQSAVTDWIPLGTVNVAAGGTVANLNWTGLEPGSRYEWYATVSDGVSTVVSTTRRFSTTAPVAPTVALTAPANGASYAPPGSVNVTATASDADGSVARVEFYVGGTKVGEDASAPYEFVWTNAPSGTYALTAVAVDNSNRATLSSVVNITVTGSAPTVALTSPADGATGNASATINFTANAADADGTVARVEFYQGSYKIGEDTSAPYTYAWTNVAPGNYLLSAVATDNAGNRTASVPVSNVISAVSSSGTLARGPYLQMAAPTRMTVRWRTSLNTTGRIRYGTSVMNLSQFVDQAPTAAPSPASGFDHAVTLPGLTPGTAYYYSIGSASDTLASGPTYTFRTSPVPGTATDTRIWVVGDCGRGTQFQRDVRDAYYAWTGLGTPVQRTPDLCLMLGDNAYNTGTDAEYKTGFYDIYPTIFRKMPLWSTLGNHDANGSPTYPYFDMFTFPTAGEAGGVASGTEYYYSFDYGNIHFINLDSQISSRNTIEGTGSDGPMAAWLRIDLASTTKPWIIVMFHHPPYSKGSHNSDTEAQMVQMRTNFNPIFDAGGVDLVLVGHSHAYERSVLLSNHYGVSTTLTNAMKKNVGSGRPAGTGAYIKPLTGSRAHFGAVYAVAGSAGSADGGALNHPAMYVSYNTGGTLNLDINGNTMNATYVEKGATTGTFTTPDTFTILKQGSADTDNDGIPDPYEDAHGLDRNNPADAALDSDGDGASNLKEYILSTTSTAPDRYAFSTSYNTPPGQATVTFPTTLGRTYRVMYSNTLLSWQPASAVVAGTGATMQWTDDGTVTGSLPSAAGKRFYRMEVTVVP